MTGGRLTNLSRSVGGQTTVITGAASGMGRATAYLFADEGARVVVADLGPDRVQAVVDEIAAVHSPEAVLGQVCDVSDPNQLRSLVEAAVGWSGRLDHLVNNAGVSLVNTAFAELQNDDEFESNWARTLDVNLTAHVRLVRFALPHLMAHAEGRVVNIASTEAIVSTAGLAAYAASKSGVAGLTKSLAVEIGRHGVTVNCICPGPIHTAMTAEIDDDAKATYARRRVPLRRYGQPEEVAHMTLNLCLPSSSFVNGITIPVDGGMTIRHT